MILVGAGIFRRAPRIFSHPARPMRMAGRVSAVLAAIWIGVLPAGAVETSSVVVRIATFNVREGVGEPGSESYHAVSNILVRIDADVVALQELQTADLPFAERLAAELRYPVVDVGGLGPFAGGFRNGFYSRIPIDERAEIGSPPGAVEMSRFPLYCRIRPKGAAEDLHLVNVHLKGGTAQPDEFRRAIEALRTREFLGARGLSGADNLLILGDLNADPDRFQTWGFWAAPDGLPASFVLGAVDWPVLYRAFPTDTFAAEGLMPLPAAQQNATSTWTWAGFSVMRRYDYLIAGRGLTGRGFAAETYNSVQDGMFPGLPKRGDPLAVETSLYASDHLIVFGDFALPAAPPIRFIQAGPSGGLLALEFEMGEGTAGSPVLEARPSIGSGTWVRLNAALEGPDPDGYWRFLTSVPAAASREYRVRETLP